MSLYTILYIVLPLLFIILAGVLGYLSYRIAGWPGAFASLIIVAVLTPIFSLSRQVMAEIPATTLAVAAVSCGYLYCALPPSDKLKAKQWRYLVAAGILLALSLLLKLLHPMAVIPVFYFISFPSELQEKLSEISEAVGSH